MATQKAGFAYNGQAIKCSWYGNRKKIIRRLLISFFCKGATSFVYMGISRNVQGLLIMLVVVCHWWSITDSRLLVMGILMLVYVASKRNIGGPGTGALLGRC